MFKIVLSFTLISLISACVIFASEDTEKEKHREAKRLVRQINLTQDQFENTDFVTNNWKHQARYNAISAYLDEAMLYHRQNYYQHAQRSLEGAQRILSHHTSRVSLWKSEEVITGTMGNEQNNQQETPLTSKIDVTVSI